MPPEENHIETALESAEKKIEQVATEMEVKLPKGTLPLL